LQNGIRHSVSHSSAKCEAVKKRKKPWKKERSEFM